MRKTRIIIIFQADPLGTQTGGSNTFIKGFIKYAPEDFEIEFVGISSDNIKRPPKRWMELKIGDKEFNFSPLFYEKDVDTKTVIPLALRFTFALKFSKINTANKILFFNRIEPAVLFKKSNSPKFAVIHNDIQKQIAKEGSEVLWSKTPWLYFMFEKFIFTFLDFIYTVSNDTIEFYKSKYPKQIAKFSFLPTWVDIEIFHPIEESKFSIREKLCYMNKDLPIKNKWILFVGRLQEQKAPIRLIDTFYRYYEKDKRACLIIIGEGNLRINVERYVEKLNIENNVFLLGSMGQELLADFYRASDVFLLTSNFEGMPICVLEALGCGLPVVATNVGEVKRVVKNEFSGEIVASFSPKIISQSIEKVLANPQVYSKDNCLKGVSEYTPEKVLAPLYEKMKNIYNRGNDL